MPWRLAEGDALYRDLFFVMGPASQYANTLLRNNHVPISVVASSEEHELITTKPQELIQQQKPIQTSETMEKSTK